MATPAYTSPLQGFFHHARGRYPGGDGVYSLEYRVIGIGDGVERWVSTRGQTVFQNGLPVAFSGVTLDITERKHAEERLRRSEAYLSAVLRHLPIGVAVFDRGERLTLHNAAFYELVGDSLPSRMGAGTGLWHTIGRMDPWCRRRSFREN